MAQSLEDMHRAFGMLLRIRAEALMYQVESLKIDTERSSFRVGARVASNIANMGPFSIRVTEKLEMEETYKGVS